MTGVQTCALPICFPVTIVVCWDGHGKYRPLRSEGNLVSGWQYHANSMREFREAMEVECRVTKPIGSRPEILGHFQKRAERLLAKRNWKPNQVSLLVASHGTPLHAGSRGAAVGLAEQLGKDGYRTARAAFLEEEPKIADWRVLVQEGPVVVLPHFLAGGLHGSEDVPELLGISGAEEGWYESEKGEIGYGEPLGRPEEVEEMIVELAVAKV